MRVGESLAARRGGGLFFLGGKRTDRGGLSANLVAKFDIELIQDSVGLLKR